MLIKKDCIDSTALYILENFSKNSILDGIFKFKYSQIGGIQGSFETQRFEEIIFKKIIFINEDIDEYILKESCRNFFIEFCMDIIKFIYK
jgi:hypothetical protein